jgi:signal transduction histidine kinase
LTSTVSHKANEQLAALASHLTGRRACILKAWRHAVERDPKLPTAPTLPRIQLRDHIPEILDTFEGMLQARTGEERVASRVEQQESAADHGMHRWQQGYQLHEVTREWGHLHLCLVDELERYAAAHPELETSVMPTARRALARLCNEGISESTSQYFRLQQTEAAGRVRDIEQALAYLNELDQQRAEFWRQAAHDLRGTVGVVKTTTTALALKGVPETTRAQLIKMLQGGVSSLHILLDDLMNLARLEAGHEQRHVGSFDAALLLSELSANMQSLARERRVFLKTNGPATLPVDGDAVKVRRIAQNLLLNALKYTDQGGVTVTWGDSRENDPERWMFCVHDTGPGFDASPGVPLAGALKAATADAQELEEKPDSLSSAAEAVPVSRCSRSEPRPVRGKAGEGIGLSIVKRLCDLLDGSLELESTVGKGTTFRVLLPRRYEPAEME